VLGLAGGGERDLVSRDFRSRRDNFSRNIVGELGCRYYYLDYTNGGALFNAAEAGVFAVLNVKF